MLKIIRKVLARNERESICVSKRFIHIGQNLSFVKDCTVAFSHNFIFLDELLF